MARLFAQWATIVGMMAYMVMMALHSVAGNNKAIFF